MPPNMPSEEEIRRRVEKRIKQRNEFYIHLAVFIVVIPMLWIMWGFTSDFFSAFLSDSAWVFDGMPWPIFPTIGWGIGIVAHGLTVYFNSPGRIEARERTIQREIERERQRLANDSYYEKPKRERSVRLTDDGELIEEDEDEAEIENGKKRKRNP
jgi:2TM domain